MQPTTLRLQDIEVPSDLLREGTPDVDDLLPSVRELGILQPLLVRAERGGAYVLVAGKRRYTAAQALGLTEVPVMIRDDLDARRARIAELTENLARREMSAHQEAKGVLDLICYQFAEHGMDVPLEEAKRILYRLSNEVRGNVKERTLRDGIEGEVVLGVFDLIGRSFGSFVTGVLPALSWPKDIQRAMDEGMSRAAARQLAGIKDDQMREEAVKRVQAGEKAADVKEEVLSGAGHHRQLEDDLTEAEKLEQVRRDEDGWLLAPPALDRAESTGLDIVPRNLLMEEVLGRFPGIKRISLLEMPAADALSALRLGVNVWSSSESPRFDGEQDSLNFYADLIMLSGRRAVSIFLDALAYAEENQIQPPRFALLLSADEAPQAIKQLPEFKTLLVAVEARGEARDVTLALLT